MKYLLALAIAFTMTLVWQTMSLEQRADSLKQVEQEQLVKVPPTAS